MSSESEYNGNTDYSDDGSCDENEILDIQNMVTIEKEVYEVYSYLHRFIQGKELLQHLNLSDVYKMMYPNYNPLF